MKVLNKYPAIKHFLKQNVLPKYLWLRSLKYLGNKLYCPCCNTGFSHFIEIGPKKEPMMCPRCRSNDRDRFFWIYLKKHPELVKSGMKILHIAPEFIYYKLFNNIAGVEYICGDKFIMDFKNTYPIDTIYIDITDMSQFADNSFDFIYCSHVLEYIKEDEKALHEFYRVLKPGGNAIISVPINFGHALTEEDESITDPLEQERLYGDKGHLRYYGDDAGFQLAFTPVKNFISEEMIQKCVIKPLDVVHHCYKK
jgi:SAM-dependent methyltransferase